MTKTEFIEKVAGKSGLTKKDAGKVVDAFIDTTTEAIAKGEKVQFTGFGNFEVHKREARKGRNPQTGAEIRISPRSVPVFKAGKSLKSAVAKK